MYEIPAFVALIPCRWIQTMETETNKIFLAGTRVMNKVKQGNRRESD